MEIINSIIQFVMDLGGAIFLPIMITVLGLIFGIKFFDSLKRGLRIGIGFIGINLIIGLLIDGLDPVVMHYVDAGAGFTITDIGWEGIASIAWSTKFALIIVPLGMILNFILIRLRFTKTMDVDVWNYFHFILGAEMDTLLFHASVVCRGGKAYMFLGPSGTGKSTHTRLWLRYIDGSRLLNDDNPVVRIEADGEAEVYGSPWSGKTPCYVNEHYPLGAIVRLRQAPHNAIRQMSPIEAYATMASSVSGKRWEKNIADGLHRALNSLTATARMWHMDCLPDEAAAKMTSSTI